MTFYEAFMLWLILNEVAALGFLSRVKRER